MTKQEKQKLQDIIETVREDRNTNRTAYLDSNDQYRLGKLDAYNEMLDKLRLVMGYNQKEDE